jgi:hypothetical protein
MMEYDDDVYSIRWNSDDVMYRHKSIQVLHTLPSLGNQLCRPTKYDICRQQQKI